jgi:hypothetical protein
MKPRGKAMNTPHHPLLKYVTNKYKPTPHLPYGSQMEHFESLHPKLKSSSSKQKRPPSAHPNPKRDFNLSLKTNEIYISLKSK